MKKTAVAPSNIALIKYWGLEDSLLRLPTNSSISMNLDKLTTITTVEFSDKYQFDDIEIDGDKTALRVGRVVEHLSRIRSISGVKSSAKVVSKNNFPAATGLSSSASGFAALTLSATCATGLKLSEKELTILARQGSGSASRSIPSGFVEWKKGTSSKTSYAQSIFAPDWWNIADIVCILNSNEKYLPTSDGHKFAQTSPFFFTRLRLLRQKIIDLKKSILLKNFTVFGEIVEKEALELHAIMFTSNPGLIYLYPETINLITLVKEWRKQGIEVYFSINTGHNIHLICQSETVEALSKKLKKLKIVKKMIINHTTYGAQLCKEHLF